MLLWSPSVSSYADEFVPEEDSKGSGSPIGCPVDKLIFSSETGERLTAKRVSEDFRYYTGGEELTEPPPPYDEDGNPTWYKAVGSIILEAEFRGRPVYIVYEQIWGVPCCGFSTYDRLSDFSCRKIEWDTGEDVPILESPIEDSMFNYRDLDDATEYSRPGVNHPLAGMSFQPTGCQPRR